MKRLIVFVHGLGAEKNEQGEFWGTTADLLRGHPRVDSSTFELEFWPYLTNKRPNLLNRFFPGKDRELASLKGLGKILWGQLRLWMKQGQYSDIKLLGHSLGGLIVASAMGYGLRHCPEDENIIQTLSGVALVVTPLRGSALADKAKLICRNNKQIMELTTDSASRKSVVDRFIQEALQKHKLPLTIFEAPEDGTLQEGDLTAPLPDDVDYSLETLSGGHSGCINSLEINHPNLEILVNWLISRSTSESYLKTNKSKDETSGKNVITIDSSEDNAQDLQDLNIPLQMISRRKFKVVISKYLESEGALKELCSDLESSSVELVVSYETAIRSGQYKDYDDRNKYLEDSVGNLYNCLKRRGKLYGFVDWLSQEDYLNIKKDLGLA